MQTSHDQTAKFVLNHPLRLAKNSQNINFLFLVARTAHWLNDYICRIEDRVEQAKNSSHVSTLNG